MVISFSVKEARDQLINEGEVYTFRWKKRRKTGNDWAQVKRNTKKIADVFIDEPRLMESIYDLDPYVSKSGFKSRKAWLDVIMKMNKRANDWMGYLYKVNLRDVITYEITCGGCGTTQIRKNLPEKMRCGDCQEAYYVEDYQEIHSLNSQKKRIDE